MPTAVSLFSGCGGFDLGATDVGVEVLWANDNDPHAAATYRNALPNVEFFQEDIRSLQLGELPRADILMGCYPCQGYSAGALRGHGNALHYNQRANPNNFLYQKFVEAIPHVQPSFFFIENVGGLQSAAGGWFFQEQLQALEHENEYEVQAFVLRMEEYGLPQARKRLFFVGVRHTLQYSYQLPLPTHGSRANAPIVTLSDMIGDMPEWPIGRFSEAPYHGHFLTRNRKRHWGQPSYTIVAHADHIPLHPLGDPMVRVGEDAWELRGDLNRRLSWDECARLQSFPVDFEPSGPIKAKYRQIGNAVPPLISAMLLRPAVTYLQEQRIG